MSDTDTYSIHWAHGQTQRGLPTYDAACDAVREVYSEAAIGHDGDISEGGESTLCWADEESSHDDDGVRAVARIRVSHGAEACVGQDFEKEKA